jgi:thiol-disulfide isomerase/thioredoxin
VTAAQLRQVLEKKHGNVVVLNLWATWCAPCIKEIPDLMRLEQDLGPRGVRLVGVAMDEPRELATRVEPFRLKFFPQFFTYARAETEMDAQVSFLDPAWNEILPTTYFIGRDGKVLRRVQGIKTYEQFRAMLEEILAR